MLYCLQFRIRNQHISTSTSQTDDSTQFEWIAYLANIEWNSLNLSLIYVCLTGYRLLDNPRLKMMENSSKTNWKRPITLPWSVNSYQLFDTILNGLFELFIDEWRLLLINISMDSPTILTIDNGGCVAIGLCRMCDILVSSSKI